MRDVRLALRLVRGAGRRDVLTLVGMALGVALTVFCLFLAGSVPVILAEQQATYGRRQASVDDTVVGAHTSSAPAVSESLELAHGRSLRRGVFVGIRPGDATPPGITTWPASGHSVVSPALGRLIAHDPEVGRRLALGVIDEGRISPEGLTDPGELLSISVRPGRRVPGAVLTYGMPGTLSMETPFTMLVAETGLLVGLPALVFLAVCLRATARSRVVRYRNLVVLGVPPARCARLYAHEVAAVAALGAAGGAVAFVVGQGTLGSSGVLGVMWWPRSGSLGPVTVLLAALVTGIVVAVVHRAASSSMGAVLGRPRRRPGRPAWAGRLARALACVALCLHALALAYLVVVCLRARPGEIHATGTPYYSRTLAVMALAAATAVPAVGLVGDLATEASVRVRWLVVRNAAQRAMAHRSIIGRLGHIVVVLLIIGGLSNGFITWVRTVTLFDRPVRSIQVDLPSVVAEREALRAAVSTAGEVSVGIAGDTYVDVRGVSCAATRGRDRRGPLTPGVSTVTVPLTIGASHRLDLSALPQDPHLEQDQVLLCREHSPWVWQAGRGSYMAEVPFPGPAYDEALATIHRTAPAAEVSAWGGRQADDLSREQALILRSGLLAALSLSITGAAIVLSGIRAGTLRSGNALLAVGAPRRYLRAVNTLTMLVPLGPACALGAAAGTLCCWGMLAMYGAENISATVLAWTALPATLLLVTLAAWGWASAATTFDRELLTPAGDGSQARQ